MLRRVCHYGFHGSRNAFWKYRKKKGEINSEYKK